MHLEGLANYQATANITVQCVSQSVGNLKLKSVACIPKFLIYMPTRATGVQLRKIIGVANYQFGMGIGQVLFNQATRISCSRKTGRIRHIYHGRKLLATLRPTDGFLALTVDAAKLLLTKMKTIPNNVIVQSDVSEFIKSGGDVFARHITRAPPSLRPLDEVIATDEGGELLGVGSALLSGHDMAYFKRGVAVRIRKGTCEVTRET